MVTILSVDDEASMEMLIKQLFRKQIKNNEYEFVFARNGKEALAKVIENPNITLVLSDINMPEMDGNVFLSEVKQLLLNNEKKRSLRTVMVSAYSDMDNLRRAMNNGAFDFVTKPIAFDDLERTIKKTVAEIEVYNKLIAEHDKLVSIQTDLNIAYEIQQSMLPKKINPYPERNEFNLHGLLEPAKSVGGDLFEYLLIDEERLFFMIGDVADKGVPAALTMAITKILFNTHFTDNVGADLVTEVKKINNVISRDNPTYTFITAFAGILNLKTGMVEYVDAGHQQPLVITSASGEINILKKKDGGLPLGIQKDYPYRSVSFQLSPGDTFFLYTDGLEDALNVQGQRYKLDPNIRLIKESLLNESPLNINLSILKHVKEFIGEANQFDDITLLTIKYLGSNPAT